MNNEEYRHRFCPPGSSSWCKYKKLVAAGSETTNYVNTINVPEFIHGIIEPIFRRLSSDDLPNMCLHGQTQNGNESLNNLIWTKCPKNTFVERPIIEMSILLLLTTTKALLVYLVFCRCLTFHQEVVQ